MDVSFYLSNAIDKHGEASIRISVSHHGIRVLTSVPYKTKPSKWDKKNQCVQKGTVNHKGIPAGVINSKLDSLRAKFGMLSVSGENAPWTKELCLTHINECLEKSTEKSRKVPVSHVMLQFIVENRKLNAWTDGTLAKFRTLEKHMNKCTPEISIHDVDKDFFSKFVGYFLNKGFTNTTISKSIKLLKWFMKWAENNGYDVNPDWKQFSSKLKEPEKAIVFLTWEELMAVYQFAIPEEKQYLDRVRDVFCFLCFTGLRYSDVANLKKSDIFDDYIQVTTIKTAEVLQIELNKYARSILKKYQGEIFPGGLVLPVISNQKTNDYLKELMYLVGLDEPVKQVYYSGSRRIEEVRPKYEVITTHCGRRTFICNALALGIPAQVVMQWTGHSDYNAMKPYIAVGSRTKKDAMSKFDDK